MAKDGAKRYQDMPLEIAGSTKFGEYPKIDAEITYNMFLSDAWLVPFSGYKNVVSINATGQGRGIYSSTKQQALFAVIDNNVYKFDNFLTSSVVGNLTTFIGDVFISENNAAQVLFSDSVNLYLYDSKTNAFSTSNVTPGFVIDFTPGYVTFQNGRFISPVNLLDGSANDMWALSDPNNGISWPNDAQHRGALQTKADETVACIRFPGAGNLLLVYGRTVAEQWTDVGAQLFPYQRSQSTNIDYGCINPATIAENENIVCWIAANEQSGPAIMYSDGKDVKRISTDGIDFKLPTLTKPTNCYGFMFRLDGHLFYIVTWPTDNLSLMYDFNTGKFYSLCDENLDFFIVKRIAFFNNSYYFVSIIDGNLYQLGSQFETFDYGNNKEFPIPRIRITPPLRMPDQSRFVIGYSGFTIEQGQFDFNGLDTTFALGTQDQSYISEQNQQLIIGGGQNQANKVPRVDLSISKDGAMTYGNDVSINMRPLAKRTNRLMWWRLGAANDLTHQFRFYGFKRFLASSGICGVYQ